MSSLKKDVAEVLGVDLQHAETQLPETVVKQAFFQKLASVGMGPTDESHAEAIFVAACNLQSRLAGAREESRKQAEMKDPVNVAISLLGASPKTAGVGSDFSSDARGIVDSMMSNPDMFAYALTATTTE